MPSFVPQIMGILNVSPDSYHSSSICTSVDSAVQRGIQLSKQGADFIDIGGEATSLARFPKSSSHTEATRVSEEEELERVIPVIRELRSQLSTPLSVDTMRPRVAEQALAAGVRLLNDQSGFRHPEMRELAGSSDVDLCVMHMQGTPLTMQICPHYPQGVVAEVKAYLLQQVDSLIKAGVKEERIILDPGIGFGKTVEHNYQLLQNLSSFVELGFRVLIGLSRKSLMGKILNKPSSQLLAPTIALNTLALTSGAHILRVHDVPEHRDVLDILTRAQYLPQNP